MKVLEPDPAGCESRTKGSGGVLLALEGQIWGQGSRLRGSERARVQGTCWSISYNSNPQIDKKSEIIREKIAAKSND